MTKQFESLLRARRNPSWLKGAQKWKFSILSSFIGAITLGGVHDAAYSMEGRTLLQPLLG